MVAFADRAPEKCVIETRCNHCIAKATNNWEVLAHPNVTFKNTSDKQASYYIFCIGGFSVPLPLSHLLSLNIFRALLFTLSWFLHFIF